jgi:multiple sugar transport system permease protein
MRKERTAFRIVFPILLACIIIPILFPFVWMVMSSIKTQVDIIAWPPRFVFRPTAQNYERVFVEQDFMKYLKNSVIVAVVAVSLSLVLGLPAAYSIARFKQKKLSVFILSPACFPESHF